jgi:hypothetical protein
MRLRTLRFRLGVSIFLLLLLLLLLIMSFRSSFRFASFFSFFFAFASVLWLPLRQGLLGAIQHYG